MGWLYNKIEGCDVFVLKHQAHSQHLNGVATTDIFWFDEKEKIWKVSPLSLFQPPKEKH